MTVEEKAGQLKFDAPSIERLGIPAYNWWNEALHGVARPELLLFSRRRSHWLQCLMIKTKRNCRCNRRRRKSKVSCIFQEGDRDIYKGLTFWSPNVNIFRDPRWGRGHETYGEDPYLTSRLGVAFVKGLQGDGDTMKAAACAKHFAVHSDQKHSDTNLMRRLLQKICMKLIFQLLKPL